MRWRSKASHTIVARADVRRLTGIDPDDVLRFADTQRLVRVGSDGVREEVMRIPLALLLEEQDRPLQEGENG
jgi:hypothetical protein